MTADPNPLSPENKNTGNVTLEDLLRLKRAERPAPEFWAGFERDLRTRQIASLMAKRPWWQFAFVPRAARATRRLRLPVGAAAALALAVVGAGHFWEIAPISAKAPTSVQVVASSVDARKKLTSFPRPERDVASAKVDALATVLSSHETATMGAREEEPRVLAESPEVVAVAADGKVDASSDSPRQLTAMVPWGLGEIAGGGPPGALASSHLLVSDPRVASMTALPVTTLLAAPPAEDAPIRQAMASAVAAAASPRDLRRARILEGIDLAGGAAPLRAVVAVNDLSDAQISDTIGRTGMVGDRFTLRF